METSYFRFSVKTNNEKLVFSHTWLITIILSTVFLITTLILKNTIATTIGYKSNSIYITYFSLIVFFDVVTAVPFARLRNKNKAFKFVTIKLINIGINLTLNIFFFVICKNSKLHILNNLYNNDIGLGYAFISNLVASATSFILLFSEYKHISFKVNFNCLNEIFAYSWPLLIIGVGGMVNETADKIFLKFLTPVNLVPLKQVGIYSANYKLAVLMTIFIQMFKYAAEPYFFKKSVSKDAAETYRVVMDYFVIFCLLIFLAVTLFIDIFKYFIGPSYHSGLKIVPIILLANMFLGIYYNLSIWYKVSNKTNYGAVIAFIGVLITLIGNLFFINKYGYMASAWTTIVCYFVMMIISYFWGSKIYPVSYNVRKLSFYTIFAIILVVVKSYIKTSSVSISIGISIILGLIFLTFVGFKERNLIKNFLWK
jgi:O-antigen/teichoic acid export membrane protein